MRLEMIRKAALTPPPVSQLLQMFSELTSIDGLLTASDWTDLFHHVQARDVA